MTRVKESGFVITIINRIVISSFFFFTVFCLVPHINNEDFTSGTLQTNQKLLNDGFTALPVRDDEVLVIDGEEQKLI